MVDIGVPKNEVMARELQILHQFLPKKRTAGGMILVSTDIVVVVLGSLSVLLGMTNIVLQSYHFLTYR